MSKITQNNFTGGVINENAIGRIDTSAYYKSLQKAHNAFCLSQGGIIKREGLQLLDELSGKYTGKAGETRIIPFHFNDAQKYLFIFTEKRIDIYQVADTSGSNDWVLTMDGNTREFLWDDQSVWEDVETVNNLWIDDVQSITHIMTNTFTDKFTVKQIKEMTYTQRGDDTIIFHNDFPPLVIRRNGINSFVYEDFIYRGTKSDLEDFNNDFTNLELGDYPRLATETLDANGDSLDPKQYHYGKAKWNDIDGYPAYGAFFGGRLYCAGTKSEPISVWGSIAQKDNDFCAYNIKENKEDSAPIYNILDVNSLSKITGIYGGRSLQLFTTDAEYINISALITPLDSAWRQQSAYGSFPNVPLNTIHGNTIFIDRNHSVREFSYDWNVDAYNSNDLTTLATQLFKNPFRITRFRDTKHRMGNLLAILNDDGTLAIMNYNQQEGIAAWTSFETNNEIVDICSINDDLFLICADDDYASANYRLTLQSFNSSIPVYLDNWKKFHSKKKGDLLVWDQKQHGKECFLILDGIVQEPFIFDYYHQTFPRDCNEAYIGLSYGTVVKSLPLSSYKYDNQLDDKRIIKHKILVQDTPSFNINNEYVTSEYYDVDVFDEQNITSSKDTGIFEYWALGWDELKCFDITSNEPTKLNILKIETHLES